MYSVIETFEKMVAVGETPDVYYMDRQKRAKHFVKTVRRLIMEKCKILRMLSDTDLIQYKDILLMREDNRHYSVYSPLGFFDGCRVFLNSTILYKSIEDMAERDRISINAPAPIYYADLLMAGVLMPSDRSRDKTIFRLKMNGVYDQFVCVSDTVLHIDERKLLVV